MSSAQRKFSTGVGDIHLRRRFLINLYLMTSTMLFCLATWLVSTEINILRWLVFLAIWLIAGVGSPRWCQSGNEPLGHRIQPEVGGVLKGAYYTVASICASQAQQDSSRRLLELPQN